LGLYQWIKAKTSGSDTCKHPNIIEHNSGSPTSTPLLPSTTPSTTELTWLENDEKAMGLLGTHSCKEILNEVDELTDQTSKAAWDYIQATYGTKKKHGSKSSILRKLRQSRFDAGTATELKEHFNAMIVLN